MLDVAMIPTADQVETWLETTYDTRLGPDQRIPHRLRTGALYPAAAAAFTECGFEVVDRLALLERPLIDPLPRRRQRSSDPAVLRRAHRRDMPALADLDQLAFDPGWGNDAQSLTDISNATPRSYRRVAFTTGRGSRVRAGFQITGQAGATGYIQRLAVHPDAWGRGIGRVLVEDAVGWLTRRGANRALVNTGVDNHRALGLYRSAAFDMLDHQLVVLEHRRAT